MVIQDLLSLLKLGYLNFYYWIVKVCIYLGPTPLWYVRCRYFLSIWSLSFHFLDDDLCRKVLLLLFCVVLFCFAWESNCLLELSDNEPRSSGKLTSEALAVENSSSTVITPVWWRHTSARRFPQQVYGNRHDFLKMEMVLSTLSDLKTHRPCSSGPTSFGRRGPDPLPLPPCPTPIHVSSPSLPSFGTQGKSV